MRMQEEIHAREMQEERNARGKKRNVRNETCQEDQERRPMDNRCECTKRKFFCRRMERGVPRATDANARRERNLSGESREASHGQQMRMHEEMHSLPCTRCRGTNKREQPHGQQNRTKISSAFKQLQFVLVHESVLVLFRTVVSFPQRTIPYIGFSFY